MNMQNLMMQAQKMQRDIEKKQKEINESEFVGKSEWVEITMLGSRKIKKIAYTIDKESLDKDDMDLLSDMITIAFNDANSKIEKEYSNKMGAYSSMLGGIR